MFNLFKKQSEEKVSTSPFFKTEKQVHAWLKYHHIQDYYLTQDLEVNVNENVMLDRERFTQLPVQFNIVKGSFYCSNNELTSLTGAPIKVEGFFDVSNNKLTSLSGAPRKVKGRFNCQDNLITNLFCLPNEIDSLNASNNKLTSVEGLGNVEFTSKNIVSIMLGENPLDSVEQFKDLYYVLTNHPYSKFNIALDYLTRHMANHNIAYENKLDTLKELIFPLIEKETLDRKVANDIDSITATKKLKI